MPRHLILVGLPGAGKTTIGRLVAAELRAPFVDLDQAIERRAGKSIPRLFAEGGEGAFRTLERAEMDIALAAPESVIAAGGGWAAQPGNLEAAAGRALTVYLQVTPEVAAARAAMSEVPSQMSDSRPLLAGGEVPTRMRELLSKRRTRYERCDVTVSANPDAPGAVALEVAELARSLAGWY
jgi:shikimate kinase